MPGKKKEGERLAALQWCGLLETGPDAAFDGLTALAARRFGVPIVLVSLVDEARLWFKAAYGQAEREAPRAGTFCEHVVESGQPLLVVPDARIDPRFRQHRLVTGPARVVFYAGARLALPDGPALGTFCLIGHEARHLSDEEAADLELLAAQAAKLIELHVLAKQRAAQLARQRETEEPLRRSESDYRQLFDRVPLPIWIYERNTLRILAANATAAVHYGYTRDDFLRLTICDLRPGDELPRLMERLARLPSGPYFCGRWRHRRSDGTIITVETIADDIAWEGRRSRIVLATDISEKLRDLRNQRLEGIGALASGIAHDLNNILAPILVAAQLMRGGQMGKEAAEYLDGIERNAQRGARLVRQILAFTRGTEGEKGPIAVAACIAQLVDLLKTTMAQEIALHLEVAGDLWPVCGDDTQIVQVLLNLAMNARDAMPRGGRLTIGARNAVRAAPAAGAVETETKRYVEMRVRDTGSGIAPELRPRIFEPFFTTKPVGQGTGLGLATVQRIVQSHGGYIEIESEVGKGTEFTVGLPAMTEA